MICKSHAFMFVFAVLGIVPGAWSAVHAPSLAPVDLHHAAQAGEAAHHVYRCGEWVLLYVAALGLAGLALSILCVVTAARRTARIERTPRETISLAVATNALARVIRVQYIASVLGYGAMTVAYLHQSFGCAIALATLSTICAGRGGDAYRAMRWIGKGGSVERRAEALVVKSPRSKLTVLAARWVFRAAERAIVPVATVVPATTADRSPS